MAALQHIFVTPALNEEVFAIVEEKIASGTKKLKGHHSLIRKIMQVPTSLFTGQDPTFGLQTIKDNLMLLDEETMMKINELVGSVAHQ